MESSLQMTEDLTQGLPSFGTLILKDANSTDDERDQIRPVAKEFGLVTEPRLTILNFQLTNTIYYQGKFWSLPGAGVGLDGMIHIALIQDLQLLRMAQIQHQTK